MTMSKSNPPADLALERGVGPLARMTMSEEAWMLRNPYALRLLMDYHDQDRAQAESMLDADQLGPWPSARFTALYERGRSIMAEDLECWDADLLRAFGFPERPNVGIEPPYSVGSNGELDPL
jgi:hypothetical protein